MMTRHLLICLLLSGFVSASPSSAAPSSESAAYVVRVGLDTDVPAPPPAVPNEAKSCEDVTFSRNLKYGDDARNVLDVATSSASTGSSIPRPVLLFVAGDQFSGENTAPGPRAALQDVAMCFAAHHGMVGVAMSYRLAPADPWPSGARDVAAAASWLHENADLFGGNRDEIVAIGYSVGAFHVASLLAHPELQDTDSTVAAAVLVSGVYRAGANAGPDEKSYFGTDATQYDQRSAFPGILDIETPLLLAWSTQDIPRLIAAGQALKERLCDSIAHCPRTIELDYRETIASMFDVEAPGGGLVEPTLELVREIEARGLP
jgi:acetyl esterase/lipase